MIPTDVFRDQPVLVGRRLRLQPLTEAVLDDYVRGLADPEVRRLTGSHRTFTRFQIERWLATRPEQHDRADWAVMRIKDGAFLGEAVLHELDPANESASFRVWLAGQPVFGRGYGTEVTQLVVDHALDELGLHRLSLQVFDIKPAGSPGVREVRLRRRGTPTGRPRVGDPAARHPGHVLRSDVRPGRRPWSPASRPGQRSLIGTSQSGS